MSMIQEDFRLKYEILSIGSIKSWGETVIDGNRNPPSVKFRATNIEGKEDPVVGLREIETIVDFQIKTKTLEEAVKLTEKIRKVRADKKPLYLVGDLPKRQNTDDILKVKNTQSLEEFLKLNNITI